MYMCIQMSQTYLKGAQEYRNLLTEGMIAGTERRQRWVATNLARRQFVVVVVIKCYRNAMLERASGCALVAARWSFDEAMQYL